MNDKSFSYFNGLTSWSSKEF